MAKLDYTIGHDAKSAIGNLARRGIIRILPGGEVELCEGEHDLEWLSKIEDTILLVAMKGRVEQ